MLQAWAYDPSGSIYFKRDITDNYGFLPHRSNSANKYVRIMKKERPPADYHLFIIIRLIKTNFYG